MPPPPDISFDDATIAITNEAGDNVVELTGQARPGMNRIAWDLQPDAKKRLGNPRGLPEFVAPGTYTVTLTIGDATSETTIEVLESPIPK